MEANGFVFFFAESPIINAQQSVLVYLFNRYVVIGFIIRKKGYNLGLQPTYAYTELA